MAVCFPNDSLLDQLTNKVSLEMTRICGEIGSFYSSIDYHSVINSPNSSIDNLLLQNLTILFNEYCYKKLDYAANILQPTLDIYCREDQLSFKKSIYVATEFLPMPIIPLYFNKEIVQFLKNVILDEKNNNSIGVTLKMNTLIVLIHFGSKNITIEDFCELFSDLFSSVHTSMIFYYYKKYFKDFYLLFKNINSQINNQL